MKSIKIKLVIMYIALVFIVMIFTGTFILMSVRGIEEQKAERDLNRYATFIEEQIINVSDEPDFQDSFNRPLTLGASIGNIGSYQASILNSSGVAVASSTSSSDMISHYDFESTVINSALNGKSMFLSSRTKPDVGSGQVKTWMEYAIPIFANNAMGSNRDIQYVVYVRMDASAILENLGQTTEILMLSLVIAIVLTAVIGFLFAGTLTGPIALLTKKAKELAEGQLDTIIDVASKDEIGQLTESFNHMSRELKKNIVNLESEKNKLEIVLFNMTDGVLAYDNNGLLLHANQISRDLLNLTDIYAVEFPEMAEKLNVKIDKYYTEMVDIEDSVITVGDKFINATFSTYRSTEGKFKGVIVVLQDITKHKKLDNIRKEFVANVSHEIRTPLTNIKSYAETLLDGAINEPKIAIDFLEVINSEADRMTLIVKDLLELSSLDNKQMCLDMADFDLAELIRDSIKQHIITAEKLNKRINFDYFGAEMIIKADKQRISQVLANILSNALKYSDENASVNITAEDSKEFYRIYIKDNGFGIPKEDLRRIFERFFRVDKARSRQLGGTGLGLSIAKEIMEAHGGKIFASSEVGVGTTMALLFPKDTTGGNTDVIVN